STWNCKFFIALQFYYCNTITRDILKLWSDNIHKDQNPKTMSYLSSVFSMRDTKHDNAPVSGGGLSENHKFSYGYASSPGKRSSMEDFFETQICGVDGQIVGLFGVFDGHGGARAAEYVKQNLFLNLRNHPKFSSDIKLAIADAYKQTDSDFLKAENNQHRDAGSTASTAVLVGNRLLVANVGDSRAVLCRSGKERGAALCERHNIAGAIFPKEIVLGIAIS
ncbi:hypothetical protein KI387_009059, partial [Taxus chinensis]